MVDYKEKMDSTPVVFSEIYEKRVSDIQEEMLNPDVCNLLKEKRKQGNLKYGEYSFQNSFENAMRAPVLEHAQEEILDALNYLSHYMFTVQIKGEKREEGVQQLMGMLREVYSKLNMYRYVQSSSDIGEKT